MALFHDRAGLVGGLKEECVSSGIYAQKVADYLVLDPIECASKSQSCNSLARKCKSKSSLENVS
jgi:hypothetical protein